MLCRIKGCIKKLSNLTNVGCHGENMLGRRKSCREGEVEDKTKERNKRRSGGDAEGLVWTGGEVAKDAGGHAPVVAPVIKPNKDTPISPEIPGGVRIFFILLPWFVKKVRARITSD